MKDPEEWYQEQLARDEAIRMLAERAAEELTAMLQEMEREKGQDLE